MHQIAAGNGITRTSVHGSVKIFDLAYPDSGTLAATVITGGVCRADAATYDPADHLLAVTNGNDTPPFLSLIAAHADPAQDKVGRVRLETISTTAATRTGKERLNPDRMIARARIAWVFVYGGAATLTPPEPQVRAAAAFLGRLREKDPLGRVGRTPAAADGGCPHYPDGHLLGFRKTISSLIAPEPDGQATFPQERRQVLWCSGGIHK